VLVGGIAQKEIYIQSSAGTHPKRGLRLNLSTFMTNPFSRYSSASIFAWYSCKNHADERCFCEKYVSWWYGCWCIDVLEFPGNVTKIMMQG
jgi:hypothetical protein